MGVTPTAGVEGVMGLVVVAGATNNKGEVKGYTDLAVVVLTVDVLLMALSTVLAWPEWSTTAGTAADITSFDLGDRSIGIELTSVNLLLLLLLWLSTSMAIESAIADELIIR